MLIPYQIETENQTRITCANSIVWLEDEKKWLIIECSSKVKALEIRIKECRAAIERIDQLLGKGNKEQV